MKNYTVTKNLFTWIGLMLIMSGCTIEPVQPDRPMVEVKGAPEWVNKGSAMVVVKDGHIFRGVSSVGPQGDMALQKSIVDDKSIEEVARVLSSFLEIVSNEYMETGRSRDRSVNEDAVSRQIEDVSQRQVNENVLRQIDESISRQYKEGVSKQFKDAVSRKIVATLSRQIKEAVANQADFAYQIDEAVIRHFKDDVTRQIRNTAKMHIPGAKIVDSWRDPRTNTLWSLSELDLRSVKNTMSVTKDINADLRQFFEAEADSIFERSLKEKSGVFSFFK